MVLKRKKIQDSPVGNTSRRKGYRSRSSKTLPTRQLKAVDEQLFRQSQTKRIKSPSEIMQSLSNYYKDLLK